MAEHLIVSFRCQVRNVNIWRLSQLMLSGMILGGCLEADHRIREYEARVRMQKRILRDKAAWESFEQEYEEPNPPKSS